MQILIFNYKSIEKNKEMSSIKYTSGRGCNCKTSINESKSFLYLHSNISKDMAVWISQFILLLYFHWGWSLHHGYYHLFSRKLHLNSLNPPLLLSINKIQSFFTLKQPVFHLCCKFILKNIFSLNNVSIFICHASHDNKH